MIEHGPIVKRFHGEAPDTSHLRMARVMLGLAKEQMRRSGVNQQKLTRQLGDGTIITVMCVYGQNIVTITRPSSPSTGRADLIALTTEEISSPERHNYYIWRSIDYGVTWELTASVLDAPETLLEAFHITINKSEDIYISIRGPWEGGVRRIILQSTDYGESWRVISDADVPPSSTEGLEKLFWFVTGYQLSENSWISISSTDQDDTDLPAPFTPSDDFPWFTALFLDAILTDNYIEPLSTPVNITPFKNKITGTSIYSGGGAARMISKNGTLFDIVHRYLDNTVSNPSYTPPTGATETPFTGLGGGILYRMPVLIKSEDSGSTWSEVSEIPFFHGNTTKYVSTIDGSLVTARPDPLSNYGDSYSADTDGLVQWYYYISTDGITWEKGAESRPLISMFNGKDGSIYSVTRKLPEDERILSISRDNGQTWKEVANLNERLLFTSTSTSKLREVLAFDPSDPLGRL